MKINQVVVMYLDTDEIVRPVAPPECHQSKISCRPTPFFFLTLRVTTSEEDVSGLTFLQWTPDVDTSRPPAAMLINSSELSASGFKHKEVLPPALEAAARVRTRGAGL
jgi:hypothetical protein